MYTNNKNDSEKVLDEDTNIENYEEITLQDNSDKVEQIYSTIYSEVHDKSTDIESWKHVDSFLSSMDTYPSVVSLRYL